MSTADPLHAISYPQSDVEDMARRAELVVQRVQRGGWDGTFVPDRMADYQDLVVLRKPAG